jgi:xanthine dehydrogenase accessory factor
MSALWVEITGTRGSTPRDAGTVMKVTADVAEGTIGGGALEFAAIAKARQMLASGQTAFAETLPLGPNLGQCCGGSVSLRYSDREMRVDRTGYQMFGVEKDRPPPNHLWLWGAGHVGRAVVNACHPQAFRITWIDTSADRFPARTGKHVKTVPAADMPLLASRAQRQAHHLIFTYSHDIDLALCAALLKRGFASCGLIGSDTKWARFRKRLRDAGLDPAPITCPIGDKSLGKAPAQIAQGVVAALMAQPADKAPA